MLSLPQAHCPCPRSRVPFLLATISFLFLIFATPTLAQDLKPTSLPEKVIRIGNSNTVTISLPPLSIFRVEIANTEGFPATNCATRDLSHSLVSDYALPFDNAETVKDLFHNGRYIFLITEENSAYSFAISTPRESDSYSVSMKSTSPLKNFYTNTDIFYCYNPAKKEIYGLDEKNILRLYDLTQDAIKMEKVSYTDTDVTYSSIREINCNNDYIVIVEGKAGATLLDIHDLNNVASFQFDRDDVDQTEGIIISKGKINHDNILTLFDKKNKNITWFHIKNIETVTKLYPTGLNQTSIENFESFEETYIFQYFNDNDMFAFDEYRLRKPDTWTNPREPALEFLRQFEFEAEPRNVEVSRNYSFFHEQDFGLLADNIKLKALPGFVSQLHHTTEVPIEANERTFTLMQIDDLTLLVKQGQEHKIQIYEVVEPEILCDFGESVIDSLLVKYYSQNCTSDEGEYCLFEQTFRISKAEKSSGDADSDANTGDRDKPTSDANDYDNLAARDSYVDANPDQNDDRDTHLNADGHAGDHQNPDDDGALSKGSDPYGQQQDVESSEGRMFKPGEDGKSSASGFSIIDQIFSFDSLIYVLLIFAVVFGVRLVRRRRDRQNSDKQAFGDVPSKEKGGKGSAYLELEPLEGEDVIPDKSEYEINIADDPVKENNRLGDSDEEELRETKYKFN